MYLSRPFEVSYLCCHVTKANKFVIMYDKMFIYIIPLIPSWTILHSAIFACICECSKNQRTDKELLDNFTYQFLFLFNWILHTFLHGSYTFFFEMLWFCFFFAHFVSNLVWDKESLDRFLTQQKEVYNKNQWGK